MRRALVLVASFPLFALSVATALANAPPPELRRELEKEPTRLVAPVVIKYGLRGEDRSVKAKIQIPASLVHGGGGGFGAAPAAGGAQPTGNAPNAPAPKAAPAPEKQSNIPPLESIIAGIALSLAAVSVVLLVRGNRATKAAAVASLVGAALLGGWSAAQADIPVAPRKPESQIVIELVEEGETVTLILPR